MNSSRTNSKSRTPGSLNSDRRPGRKQAKLKNQNIYYKAFKDAFVKLRPKNAIKNPVMFLVWVGTIITLLAAIHPSLFGAVADQKTRQFNGLVTLILFVTAWIANFAEAIAEGRGKAQANSLRSIELKTVAKKLADDGTITEVHSTSLQRGDTVYLVAGDIIPADGEVIMGIASVDESVITGESAPVLKESGSQVASSVTGGSRIISDELIVRITADPGKGFIQRMIALMEGRKRRKTPNEIALKAFLGVMALLFLLVVVTLPAFALYLKSPISVVVLIALLLSLIPTTVGGLLSTISIAAMDRVAQCNIIATSERIVEACVDVNTLIVDKTGTITLGNRLAEEFIPVKGHSLEELANVAMAASLFDDTPEGKSIFRLADSLGARIDFDYNYAQGISFSPAIPISGTNLPNGSQVRKGTLWAIKEFVGSGNGNYISELDQAYEGIAKLGATPLAIAMDGEIYGLVALNDIVKPGIRDRFGQLRRMGVRSIMVTGDNQITAAVIAQEAGVDDFIAETQPENKITLIEWEQSEGKLVAMTGEGTNDALALAQANIGIAMNTGTQAAKEAANMVDLDSDPTKLIDIIAIGKQLLITRGALTTFSIANDIAKYFAIVPLIFAEEPNLKNLNLMNLTSIYSGVLSVLIYNACMILALMPLALRGIGFTPVNVNKFLQYQILIYGLGGLIFPFIAIKLIDMLIISLGFV
ncbi:MAG: potassium-transporting ATPase subunit KdpB [Nostocaceae cyanobacterium]|nr:potassium-transporting ATPase subunit KdpB [Nostocaceae cyanobacterium]